MSIKVRTKLFYLYRVENAVRKKKIPNARIVFFWLFHLPEKVEFTPKSPIYTKLVPIITTLQPAKIEPSLSSNEGKVKKLLVPKMAVQSKFILKKSFGGFFSSKM